MAKSIDIALYIRPCSNETKWRFSNEARINGHCKTLRSLFGILVFLLFNLQARMLNLNTQKNSFFYILNTTEIGALVTGQFGFVSFRLSSLLSTNITIWFTPISHALALILSLYHTRNIRSFNCIPIFRQGESLRIRLGIVCD